MEFEDNEEIDPRAYQEIVGSLIYAMTWTRPDLNGTVTKLTQHLSKPKKGHMTAAKHVLRYLKGTLDYELSYKSDQDLQLLGQSDADWGSDEDRRSISGYCFSLSKSVPFISWKTRKQAMVALSTSEAEYMALAAATQAFRTTQESLYLTQLLRDLGFPVECQVTILEDNQGAILLSQNPVIRPRSKHIDIRYHFICTEVSKKRVKIVYCQTQEMVADVLTKPSTKEKLLKFKDYRFGH